MTRGNKLSQQRMPLSNIAFTMALTAFLGVMLVSFRPLVPLGFLLANLGPVAVILGIVSAVQSPARSARWAIVIGIIASLYLPTFWLGVLWLF